jgi:hypothetical protein
MRRFAPEVIAFTGIGVQGERNPQPASGAASNNGIDADKPAV